MELCTGESSFLCHLQCGRLQRPSLGLHQRANLGAVEPTSSARYGEAEHGRSRRGPSRGSHTAKGQLVWN